MNKQFLILISGHLASGKTRIAKQIEKEFNISRINGDDIRDFIISHIKYYSDTHYSYPNEKINSANIAVLLFKKELLNQLLEQGQSVIVDGAGISKASRANYLEYKKRFSKLQVIIVAVQLDEKETIKRLKKRDKKDKKNRWVDFHQDIRKKEFKEILNNEADYVIRFNQHNSEEVIKTLSKIINSL